MNPCRRETRSAFSLDETVRMSAVAQSSRPQYVKEKKNIYTAGYRLARRQLPPILGILLPEQRPVLSGPSKSKQLLQACPDTISSFLSLEMSCQRLLMIYGRSLYILQAYGVDFGGLARQR